MKYVRFAANAWIALIFSLISYRVCELCVCVYLLYISCFITFPNATTLFHLNGENGDRYACVHEMEIEAYANNYL